MLESNFVTVFSYFFLHMHNPSSQKVNDRCAPSLGSATENKTGKVAQKVLFPKPETII